MPDGDAPTRTGAAITLPSPIPDVTLDSELGRGGMGIVYRGRQTYLDRTVAVKLLLVQGAAGQDFVRRFQREAKILASLAHPHIVSCYQAGVTAANNPYLVMEFIDGPTLKDWVVDHGRVPVPAALTLVRDLARALEHALESGIIHRDIKPENVLLARKPVTAGDAFPFITKLVDLGLARPTAAAGDMQLTREGAIVGTPSTMAPEQFDDPDHVDYRADIYGLGCVLYHALVGKPAYDGQTLVQIVTAKVSGEIPQATRAKADIPLPVNALINDLLARNRDQRPQSYRDIIERCDLLLGTDVRKLGQQGNRSAWIGVGAIAVVLGGAAWYWSNREQPVVPPPSPATASPATPAPAPVSAPVVATRVPLAAIPESDWLAPTPLWQFDQAQRLKQWTLSANAQWSSAETRDDAVAGIAGRIQRPLPKLPCRIQGQIHHANEGALKSDRAQVGILLADGGRIDLTVLNLGPITHAVVNSYKAHDEIPSSSQGPVTLPASRAVPFTLIIREDGFLASVDGNAFAAIPLSGVPESLYLGAEGQAPVEISGLTVRQHR